MAVRYIYIALFLFALIAGRFGYLNYLFSTNYRISRFPEHHYSYLQELDMTATYYSRELPYSFDFLVENLADPAHIPFAHHKLLGKH
jgi:hypothetical protein